MELELGDLHALVSTPSDRPGAKIFSFFNLLFLFNFGGFDFILGTKIKVIFGPEGHIKWTLSVDFCFEFGL